ncbi:MAG: Flp family type IVb pilin [Nanoarchaeota archaeon]|nr:Flp family type IVb pilin [Nanoarchaeota archaeon]
MKLPSILGIFNKKKNREAEENERTFVLQRLSQSLSKKEINMFEQIRLLHDEKGMIATEYAIMVAIITGIIVGAVTYFGGSVNGLFDKVLAALKIAG